MTQLDLSNLSIDELNKLMEERKQEIEQERIDQLKKRYTTHLKKHQKHLSDMQTMERNAEWYSKRVPSMRENYKSALNNVRYVHNFNNVNAERELEQFIRVTESIRRHYETMKDKYESQSDEWKYKIERALEEHAWEIEKKRFLKEDMI